VEAKPRHLGPEYASQFADEGVDDAYLLRPPYPDETFDVLERLSAGASRRVLDLGAGTGDLARPLARRGFTVDAVDVSARMIARGRTLPGGDSPRVRWHLGRAEDPPPDPPYALVVAGQAFPWFEWDVVLEHCRDSLEPRGVVALVERAERAVPWEDVLKALIVVRSTNREYRPYDLLEELRRRGLFEVVGRVETALVPFSQSVSDYVEAMHSRNGFTRARMGAAADLFDGEARGLLAPHAVDGVLHLFIGAEITWGRPSDRARPPS
jgi:SAM-dependent methyltransferase